LAARRWPTLAFAVVDLWGEWPVDDATVDLVLSIFAPKNFGEIGRVLRPGGWLALAFPGPEHLIELRDRFKLLRQKEESSGRYAEMTARYVGPPFVARLHQRTVLEPEMVRAAILMGPNGRHVDPAALNVGATPLAVTLDINLLFAAKPGSTS
jgi:23S rRNA (guanine745-N1)-methyltransferase